MGPCEGFEDEHSDNNSESKICLKKKKLKMNEK
jgi:hypothetical protein